MRRSILAAATAAALALTLSACGSSTNGSSNATSSAAAATGTLTIWVDETRVDSFKEIATDFQQQTSIALDVVQKPSGDIRTDFESQAPTGNGPDLIVTANDATGSLVDNGVISTVELGDALAGLDKTAVDAFTYNGKLYGVPYALENIGLVRNNKLAKSTPDTFDKLIAAKPAGAEYAILVQEGDAADPYHTYPIQSSFGAPVFVQGSDGGFTTDLGMGGEKGKKFAEYLSKLADDGVLNSSIDAEKAKQLFIDGKSPYIITGPWYTTAFTEAGMDFTVEAVPSAGGEAAAPFVGAQGVFLSAFSKNTLTANQFLEYMAGEKAQTLLYKSGGRMPANTTAAGAVDDPILKGFAAAAEGAAPMPNIPEMAGVWESWSGAEAAIINGKTDDPAKTWQTMVDNLQKSLS